MDAVAGEQIQFSPSPNRNRPFRATSTAAVMAALVQNMAEEDQLDTQRYLTKQLEKAYGGVAPAADHETEVTLTLNEAAYTEVLAGSNRLNLMVAHVESAATETSAPAVTREPRVSRPKRKSVSEISGLLMGEVVDGTIVERPTWKPGHDSKWKSVLITRMKSDGDQNAADEMVQRGWLSEPQAQERMAAYAEYRDNAAEREAAALQKAVDKEVRVQARLEAKAQKEAERAQRAEAKEAARLARETELTQLNADIEAGNLGS